MKRPHPLEDSDAWSRYRQDYLLPVLLIGQARELQRDQEFRDQVASDLVVLRDHFLEI